MALPLSPAECYNPHDARCAQCAHIEMAFGACPVLGHTEFDRIIGAITGWGMYTCLLIPLLALALRRTSWLWAGFTPIWAIILSSILQSNIPSIRPAGCCSLGEQSCGMPSGHCMTAYSTFYFILLARIRKYKRRAQHQQQQEEIAWVKALWMVIVGVFMCVQFMMAYGRVAIHYHTKPQVFWGFTVGMCIGFAWYATVLCLFGPRVGPWLERKWACLGVVDDWNHPKQQQDAAALLASDVSSNSSLDGFRESATEELVVQ